MIHSRESMAHHFIQMSVEAFIDITFSKGLHQTKAMSPTDRRTRFSVRMDDRSGNDQKLELFWLKLKEVDLGSIDPLWDENPTNCC